MRGTYYVRLLRRTEDSDFRRLVGACWNVRIYSLINIASQNIQYLNPPAWAWSKQLTKRVPLQTLRWFLPIISVCSIKLILSITKLYSIYITYHKDYTFFCWVETFSLECQNERKFIQQQSMINRLRPKKWTPVVVDNLGGKRPER